MSKLTHSREYAIGNRIGAMIFNKFGVEGGAISLVIKKGKHDDFINVLVCGMSKLAFLKAVSKGFLSHTTKDKYYQYSYDYYIGFLFSEEKIQSKKITIYFVKKWSKHSGVHSLVETMASLSGIYVVEPLKQRRWNYNGVA